MRTGVVWCVYKYQESSAHSSLSHLPFLTTLSGRHCSWEAGALFL